VRLGRSSETPPRQAVHGTCGFTMKFSVDKYKPQSGCIPITGSNDSLRVLLITNKSGSRWVLPKGSIKSSETPEHAAKRETKEEAGVKGDITGTMGVFYDHKKEYAIQFFVLRVTKEKKKWDEKRKRQRKWFTIGEALEAVKKKYIVELLEGLAQTASNL